LILGFKAGKALDQIAYVRSNAEIADAAGVDHDMRH
jgi:hypothetical protein